MSAPSSGARRRRESSPNSLPSTIMGILDAVQVPIGGRVMRALVNTAEPGRAVGPQRLARVAAYEEEAFLRSRGTPRFCWVLNADGTAVSPRMWARGDWPLSRRIKTDDVVPGWNAAIAVFLCEKMLFLSPDQRQALAPTARQAVTEVLGPPHVVGFDTDDDWSRALSSVARHQALLGAAQSTVMQDEAASDLASRELSAYSLFFGVESEAAALPRSLPPAGLHLLRDGEESEPFDDLVRRKATDPEEARDVLAYIQEWGSLVDQLGRSPSLREYAEYWVVDLTAATARNERFRGLFPKERDPTGIWHLLWEGANKQQSFVRVTGVRVSEVVTPPSVAERFISRLAFDLGGARGRELAMQAASVGYQNTSAAREQRRFFVLCDRAFANWSVKALAGAAELDLSQALLSMGGIYDEHSASDAEQVVGDYRRRLPAGAVRDLLLAVQKLLRVGATLEALTPPRDTQVFLAGVEWAAKALAAAATDQSLGVDPVYEAVSTVKVLAAVH